MLNDLLLTKKLNEIDFVAAAAVKFGWAKGAENMVERLVLLLLDEKAEQTDFVVWWNIGRKRDSTIDVAVAGVKIWLRKRMGRTFVQVGGSVSQNLGDV